MMLPARRPSSPRRPTGLALLAALLLVAGLAPAGTASAAGPRGGSVTLPGGSVVMGGRVLPPMPREYVRPSVQAEELSQHPGLPAGVGGVGAVPQTRLASPASGSVAGPVSVLGPTATGTTSAFAGPGGWLPNGLRREVLGFLPHWMLDAGTLSALRYDLLSTVAYFGIGAAPSGMLIRGTNAGWLGWSSSAMTGVIDAAHARGVRVVPTITMMAWSGDYSGMTALLTAPANRARLISEIAGIIAGRRADGVNIDFEPVPTSLRGAFTTFIRELKAGLVRARVPSYVTVDTMAGAATWATGYDVVGLTAAGAADALMVMAYDLSWSGSARAGGVAPIDSPYIFAVRDALNAHLAVMPASKLIWGVPYYGRSWPTTSAALNAVTRPSTSSSYSRAFGYIAYDGAGNETGARAAARVYGRRWDAVGQVPWFASWDAANRTYRQGYYDDGASLQAKYRLVGGSGLAGIGIWSLGMDTGTNEFWNVIYDRFVKLDFRLAGADRYATAAAVSAASFAADGPALVYLATGTTFADGLAAVPAAARASAPLLLLPAVGLPATVASELRRLNPSQLMVLGGSGAVSPTSLAAIRALWN
ncbi:MAG: hypothetical protein DLM71_05670 [Chloroflexi bacterium]|nr:MAG: hypothetical protein DLM71_05670 [Chloroflexota bacterium]